MQTVIATKNDNVSCFLTQLDKHRDRQRKFANNAWAATPDYWWNSFTRYRDERNKLVPGALLVAAKIESYAVYVPYYDGNTCFLKRPTKKHKLKMFKMMSDSAITIIAEKHGAAKFNFNIARCVINVDHVVDLVKWISTPGKRMDVSWLKHDADAYVDRRYERLYTLIADNCSQLLQNTYDIVVFEPNVGLITTSSFSLLRSTRVV